MRRRNGRGFALRGGRSTRSQTGLAPGASAAHRRRMADEEKPKRKRAVARQASNPLEAAEKRGVPGGLAKGPRRGGAPNRPPLPPREAATLRGRENARRRSREPSPMQYIIILNHRQTLCFQSNPLHRQNGKVRIHLHAARHGIPQPHGIRRIDHVRRPEATGIGPLYAVKHGCPLPAATMPFSVPKCLSPRSETASGNSATSSSDMVTFLHSTQSLGIPGPSSKPSNGSRRAPFPARMRYSLPPTAACPP